MGALQFIAKTNTNSGSSSSNITFDSIPQTYTDLYVMCIMKETNSTAQEEAQITYNNTGSSQYAFNWIRQTSSSVASTYQANNNAYSPAIPGNTSNNTGCYSNTQIFIPNYRRTDRPKQTFWTTSVNMSASVGTALTQFGVVTWANNNAITRIDLINPSPSWSQYCTFYLYGIDSTP